MRFEDVSNEELLASLKSCVGHERRIVAKVIAYLVEVEERRLHLEVACSSMHDFCIRKVGLSEGAAYRRLKVAKVARRFPQVLDAIGSGRVHLSNVLLLEELFTNENVDQLLASAAGKTKNEVNELIARLAPKADVPDSIEPVEPQRALVVTPAAASGSMLMGAPATNSGSAAGASSLRPLAEDRYCITFTASGAMRETLEKVTALMRHTNPSGDLSIIFGAALELLLEKIEKQKLRKTERPLKGKAPADPRDVTNETVREVVARDEQQCTYVGANGERCPARELLELDHSHPRALGGSGETENIRILCRAHNRLAAEKVFGREHVEQRIRESQQRRASAPAQLEAAAMPEAPIERAHTDAAAVAVAVAVPVDATLDVTSTVVAVAAPASSAAPARIERTGASDRAHAVARAAPEPRQRVLSALVGMGFRSKEAQRAVDELTGWARPLESLVVDALRLLT